MVSFEVHWPRRAATGLGLLAALAVPCARLLATARPTTTNYAQLAEQILETQTQGGAYAKELIDPLTTLSFLYAENGDHSLAAAVTEQALQVIRANYGLRTLEQAPLIRQRIVSEEARGNFEEAWVLEHALLDLAERIPTTYEPLPIFHEVGDKRLDLLARYVDGERPPQLGVRLLLQARAGANPEASRAAAPREASTSRSKPCCSMRKRTMRAQSTRCGGSSSTRAASCTSWKRNCFAAPIFTAARTRWASKACSAAWRTMSRIRRRWRIESKRCCRSPTGSSCSAIGLRRRSSMNKCMRSFEQHGGMQHLIDEVFSPATPVVLPTFVPSSLAADPSPSSTGHIDVAFEITQYGKARRIEILDTTRNASRAARHRLVRLIGESRFRPRIVDGQFARAAPVVLRDIPPDVTVDEQPIRSIREVGPARRHDAPEG